MIHNEEMERPHKLRFAAALLALAAAYWLASRVGLWMSLPAVLVSSIWPPAGIALGALLRWGTWLWPGVLIGGIASSLSYLPADPGGWGPVIVASVVGGAGSTLRSVLATMLIRRLVGPAFAFADSRRILRFLLLAGPAASLVSATVGNLGRVASGLLPLSDFPATWLTWWTGDTIGALTFAPVILIWGPAARDVWRSRRFPVTLTLTAAFVAVTALMYQIGRLSQARVETRLRRGAEVIAAWVQRDLNLDIATVQALADVSGREASPSEDVMRAFFRRGIAGRSEIVGLAWATPRLAQDEAEVRFVEPPSAAETMVRLSREVARLPLRGPSLWTVEGTLIVAARSDAAPGAGVAFAAVRLQPLIQTALRSFGEGLPGLDELSIGILDGETLMFSQQQGGSGKMVLPLRVGDRRWELRVGVGRRGSPPWQVWVVFTGGLAFLVFLEGLLLWMVGGAGSVERRVTGELARSNDELRTALEGKEVLLRELHHRVKNNLQVISSLFSLQARYLTDPRQRAIFDESRNRIFSIALVHERLYRAKDLAQIDFSGYARQLIEHLRSVCGAQTIAVETQIDEVRMPVETAIPCGLLINELVTNAFKHAFPDGRPGAVKIALHADGPARWVVAVEDDGVGLPAGLDIGRSDSLGLDLVSILAKQIGADVEVRRGPGTCFRFSFSGRRVDA